MLGGTTTFFSEFEGVTMQVDGVIVPALVIHGEAIALSALGGEQGIGGGPRLAIDRPAVIARTGWSLRAPGRAPGAPC